MQDALALEEIPQVEAVLPAVSGNAEVEGNNRQRRVTVIGVNHTMPQVFSMQVAGGQFLPQDDPVSPRAFAVLGYKLRVELFGDRNPLGERIRIGGSRFLVVGTMESKGQVLGFDLDDTVYIPTVRAQELFNQEGLMEIDVLYEETADVDTMVRRIKRLLNARHGQEDYTITTQQQMLDVLGSVLDVLTFAVMALGSISLLVGGVGILTIMSIAVTERTSEVGLLRALGARQNSIVLILLVEAAGLSAIGGLAGLAIGVGGGQLLGTLVPGLPVKTPWDFVIIAEVLAIAIGIVAGILPARRAAKMDPVEALRTE
jgi:putative ABC transport system permease protein